LTRNINVFTATSNYPLGKRLCERLKKSQGALNVAMVAGYITLFISGELRPGTPHHTALSGRLAGLVEGMTQQWDKLSNGTKNTPLRT